MDTLTHALSGVLLTRATTPGGDNLPIRRQLVIGFLAGLFPDSDFLLWFFTDPLSYLNYHRGITHSLLLLPLWGMVLGVLFAWLWRDRANWYAYFRVCTAVLLIHVAGDVITNWGTQILAPFSDYKAAFPVTFIIDLWFSGIIITGLLLSLIWRRSRRPAIFGLLILAGYVTFQSMLYFEARMLGARHAAATGLTEASVQALPQPLSPFYWKIIIQNGSRYEIANVNLSGREPPRIRDDDEAFTTKLRALYQPPAQLQWRTREQFGTDRKWAELAKELLYSEPMTAFRRFAVYPALASIKQGEKGLCFWYTDLRFVLEKLRAPFKFGMCRNDGSEQWRLYRLNDGDAIAL